MAQNKIVKSLSLRPSTIEAGHAVIDMYGLGDNMESKLADAVLHAVYSEMASMVPEQTVTGLKFSVNIELEFDEVETS